ncbi:hypothetical protein P3T73_14730 [Kiritimatiellota bacterium B12222]|nr:hypothetical protein P3T73_14730 [Kiritimatiellota bacterium B12222]
MKNLIRMWWMVGMLLMLPGVQAEEQKLSVKMMVPDATWRLSIDEVVQVEEALWVVASLSQVDGMMGIQVISTVEAEQLIEASDLPVKIFVVGKTWAWKNEEPYTFLETRASIAESLSLGVRIFSRDGD